jgi:hypothetical protein
MSDKQSEFRSIISSRWFSQIRDLDAGSDVLKTVRNPRGSITESEFKWHLADAILNKLFSVEEYERLTDLDFDTREEVADDLMRLWRLMFDGEAVALPIERSQGLRPTPYARR